MGWVTSAQFSLTWGTANGELTVAVKNLTTGPCRSASTPMT